MGKYMAITANLNWAYTPTFLKDTAICDISVSKLIFYLPVELKVLQRSLFLPKRSKPQAPSRLLEQYICVFCINKTKQLQMSHFSRM